VLREKWAQRRDRAAGCAGEEKGGSGLGAVIKGASLNVVAAPDDIANRGSPEGPVQAQK
jgi:hypothetical protein